MKIVIETVVNHHCGCGRITKELPKKFKVLYEGSECDGIYFDCECGSTAMIRLNSLMDRSSLVDNYFGHQVKRNAKSPAGRRFKKP